MAKSKLNSEVQSYLTKWIDSVDFKTSSIIKEASSGTAIAPFSAIASKDRTKLEKLYEKLRNSLKDSEFDVQFNQNRVNIMMKAPDRQQENYYTPYMANILEHMILEGRTIEPLPEIKIRRDLAESADIFGKTAYYDPQVKEVVLYVENRHPKDVLRSFCHEMVHHIQNLEGRLVEVDTTNINNSDALRKLEEEAYLEGNILFRGWEDKIKNSK